MNNNNNNNTEIDLMNVIIRLLLKWKIILIVGVLLAVSGGIYTVYSGYSYNKNQSELSESNKSINETKESVITPDNVDEYLSKQELTDNEVNKIIKALNRAKESVEMYEENLDYLNNSEYMKSETINESEMKITFNSEEDILINRILFAYENSLKSKEFYEYIKNVINPNLDVKYIEEMFETSLIIKENSDSSCLIVEFYNSDSKQSDEIANKIVDWISDSATEMSEKFGPHKFVLIGQSTHSIINSKFINNKSKNYSTLSSGLTDITNLKNELAVNEQVYFVEIFNIFYANSNFQLIDNQSEEINSSQSFSPFNYKANLLKNSIIGFVIGAGLTIVYLFLNILCSNKLTSEKDIIYRYNLNVFGGILTTKPTSSNPIDRILHKIYYEKLMLFKEKNIETISNLIKLNALKNSYNKILITGEFDLNINFFLNELKEKIEQQDLDIQIEKSIIDEPQNLLKLNDIDGIIFIERVGITKFDKIEKELYICKNENVNVMGAIVIY